MSRMRLLDTRTRSFRTVNDPRKVRYAILSHVWRKGPEGDPLEQTYLDVCQSQASATVGTIPALSEKLERFCDIAERGGCELAWADSCCIDKRSSSELSEAINSMYDWYRYADVCYVYLHDVFANSHREETEIQFVESEWHRRGWTLQELLAPRIVLFVSAEWQLIGSKLELAGLIQRATHIPRSVLTFERRVADCSVACRMSWAASRETTKVEDQAYSLLGIFGVNMPTTYGEGSYAFIRLQREILKNIHDQTIFAWGTVLERHSFSFFGRSVSTANLREDPFPVPDSSPQYLLAASPKEFEHSADFRPICWQQFLSRLGRSIEEPNPIYTATSSGIRTRLPLLPVIATDYQTNLPSHLAILACERDSNTEGTQLVAILLRPQSLASSTDFLASAVVARMADLLHTDRIQPDSHVPDVHRHHYRLAYITDRELTRVVAERVLSFEDVCVPYRPSQLSDDVARDASFHAALRQAKSFELFVCSWSKQLLALRGYNVRTSDYRQQATSRTGSPTVITIIGRAGKQYNIKICHCGCRFGSSQYYLSVTVSSIGARGVPRYHGPGLPASGSHHSMDDPSHVYSWNYGNGVASQKFELQPIPQRELVTMQLTISRVSHESPASSECTRYALGIEIWDGCGEYLQALPSSKDSACSKSS
ncbi:HET-domain-containing protein [Cubamyces sp. BRFM 1775]|nr:HET-domain-containing protein [Cubamyces sp. BRFM 1775]